MLSHGLPSKLKRTGRPPPEHVLTLDCPETRGLVHAVSGFLLEQGCDILESKQFDAQDDGHFFMRIHFASARRASPADRHP